ncbi:MAG: hypothetical protein AB7L90_21245 [Hyphomicrobiaceae bacterium]
MTAQQNPPKLDFPFMPWASFMAIPGAHEPAGQVPGAWALLSQSAAAAEPVVRSAARAQLELSSLVGTRVKAWSAIPETLSRCRTPMDLMQAQMAFWQTAARDYSTASRHVMAAWASAVAGGSGEPLGDKVAPRDFITFPETADATEERRHPGASRRAA